MTTTTTPALPTLGEMADQYYEARAERLALQKQVEEAKERETAAESILINCLKAQGLEGAKGHIAVAAIKRTDAISTEKDDAGNDVGRAKLEEFILETGDLSLLQFRPSVTRCKELWDEGIAVPGVRKIQIESISLTKVKVRG